MKKRFQNIVDKEARKRTEGLHESLQGVAAQIAKDQAEWMDQRMKDLLRPDIYEKARLDDEEYRDEVDGYFKAHQIRITFIPDTMRIRIMVRGTIYSEFIPQILLDGEPVDLKLSPETGLN